MPEVIVWPDDAELALAAADCCRFIGTNRLGGETFELEVESNRYFLKRQQGQQERGLDEEVAKITWASAHGSPLQVSHANLSGEDQWFVTTAIAGQPLSAADFAARPQEILGELANGLRRFHDSLPAERCPWERRFDHLGDLCLADNQQLDKARWWSAENRELPLDELRERLRSTPAVDELVVCHGDPFFSNFMHNETTGKGCFIDLDRLARADRWADLAAASLAIDRRLGTDPRWVQQFLHSYGVDPDIERLAYYRLCWDVEPD